MRASALGYSLFERGYNAAHRNLHTVFDGIVSSFALVVLGIVVHQTAVEIAVVKTVHILFKGVSAYIYAEHLFFFCQFFIELVFGNVRIIYGNLFFLYYVSEQTYLCAALLLCNA